MRSRRLILLLVIIAVCIGGLLAAFIYHRHCYLLEISDEWLSVTPPGTWDFAKAVMVPFAEVKPKYLKAAEKQLKDEPFAALKAEEAVAMSKSDISPPPNLHPFLVRAIAANEGTGRFSVYLQEGNLLVRHGSLGHYVRPIKHRPLVIWLTQPPHTVYVSLSVAR